MSVGTGDPGAGDPCALRNRVLFCLATRKLPEGQKRAAN